MKIKSLIIGVLVAAAMAGCDKKSSAPSSENRKLTTATSPAPTVSVKASGTINGLAEDAPIPTTNADSSPTPPK